MIFISGLLSDCDRKMSLQGPTLGFSRVLEVAKFSLNIAISYIGNSHNNDKKFNQTNPLQIYLIDREC